jgi:hypothetical protein
MSLRPMWGGISFYEWFNFSVWTEVVQSVKWPATNWMTIIWFVAKVAIFFFAVKFRPAPLQANDFFWNIKQEC